MVRGRVCGRGRCGRSGAPGEGPSWRLGPSFDLDVDLLLLLLLLPDRLFNAYQFSRQDDGLGTMAVRHTRATCVEQENARKL